MSGKCRKERNCMFKKGEGEGNKTKRRITEVGIAVIILAALILIKLAAGGKLNPTVSDSGTTLFDIYSIEIPEFDGNNYVITIRNLITIYSHTLNITIGILGIAILNSNTNL